MRADGKLLQHRVRRLACRELASRLGEQRVARSLCLPAQLADRRRGVPHLEARHERGDVGVDDAPRRGGLGLARLHVLVDDLPQVVDRIKVGVLEGGDRRVDVARHGEVEHEHRPVAALLERALHVGEADHEPGTRGRGDDDVGLRQVRGERLEADHRGGQTFGDALGAVGAAVRDDEAADLLRVQVARRELDHLAGADEERSVPFEAREHAPREPDSRGGDRDRVRADRGLRPHPLGHREGGLEQPVQQRAGRACLLRGAVRVLELAEDLRLAEDQRVEPGGDGERVAHRVRSLDAVQASGERPVAAGFGDQPVCERFRPDADAVELGAVTGGDDQRLGEPGQGAERRERARQPLGVEHDAFTHLDRRGAVVQAEDEERHAVPGAEIRRIVR